jgi:transposase
MAKKKKDDNLEDFDFNDEVDKVFKESRKKKSGIKLTTDQRVEKLDQSVINKIVQDKKGEMVVEANKLAKQLAAKIDLQIQDDLTEDQNSAAMYYANGFSITEVCDKFGLSPATFEAWLKTPAFMKKVNEYIYSEGMVTKGAMIRKEKRIANAISDALIDKMMDPENGLDNLSVTTLHKMNLDQGRRISELIDDGSKNASNSIAVMIVNHFKNTNKGINNLDDLLNNPAYDFRGKTVIDIDAEEIDD